MLMIYTLTVLGLSLTGMMWLLAVLFLSPASTRQLQEAKRKMSQNAENGP
jgi:hypothetical protein